MLDTLVSWGIVLAAVPIIAVSAEIWKWIGKKLGK